MYDRNQINLAKITETRIIIKDTLGLDSLKLYYFENGNLYKRVPYKNGKINGYYEEYYYNGQLKARERRIDNYVEDGYCYYYAIDGSIVVEGKYKNGKQVGKWIHYVFREPFKIRYYNKKGELKKVKEWSYKKKLMVKSLRLE